MIKTLREACTPRHSVLADTAHHDDVYRIDDLDTLDPAAFFEENFVTSGMRTLLTEVFSRMDGSNPDASGAFLLSQSMGGGKTHNLLALGLLARYPEFREIVMGPFYQPRPIPAIEVVTFNGRENPEFGIWGLIAEKLGRRDAFARFYTPLSAPGESDWITILSERNILILIDELPPYLHQALQQPLGQSTLAHATVTALANLLAAVNSGKLPNVTLVLTDLSGSSYEIASDQLTRITGDLKREAERTVQVISPVRLDTPELYDILRTRLFAHVPDRDEIRTIADEFHRAILDAGRVLDIPVDRADATRDAFRQTYPFHPEMLSLFARFRENQGYQQTRAMLRIARQIVRNLWDSGAADRRFIIGAHDVNPSDQRIISEINKFNQRLENAIAHDIVNDTHTAVAQVADGSGSHTTQDIAILIWVASLSTAASPVLGLTESEVVLNLAGPDRTASDISKGLRDLSDDAWYLYATADGKLLFRATENVRAKIQSSIGSIRSHDVEKAIAERLEELFAPHKRDVYQQVKALPDLREITNSADQTVLVLARPDAEQDGTLTEFYNSLQYKNRILFLVCRSQEYQTLHSRAVERLAADQVIKQLEQDSFKNTDPQMIEARNLRDKYQGGFYMALREVFTVLLVPQRTALYRIEIAFNEIGEKWNGEAAIRDVLVTRSQFVATEAMMEEPFRTRIEKELWPTTQDANWNDLRLQAAQSPGFPLHTPGKLDDVKQQAIARGHWRELGDGKHIQKGPFEKEKAKVLARTLSPEPDPETGEVTIRVEAFNADQVIFTQPDGTKQMVNGGQLTTSAIIGTFSATDSTGEHESDVPFTWRNKIVVRHQINDTGGGERYVTLKALPQADIRYTTDGSSPITSGIAYTAPIRIDRAATTVLAIAERDGVRSEPTTISVPSIEGEVIEVTIDPGQPARWKNRIAASSTAETFTLLQELETLRTIIHHLELSADATDGGYSTWTMEGDDLRPDQVRSIADTLKAFHPTHELRLSVRELSFELGRDLKQFALDHHKDVVQGDVTQ